MAALRGQQEPQGGTSESGPSGIKIRIGGIDHVIDTRKIPYFAAFLDFQTRSGNADNDCVPEHDDIPYFETINAGVNNGFRVFFQRMPSRISEYQVLCETLEFLAVDVLSGRDLKAIMKDLREGQSDWDPEERHVINGNKALARDSAFRLLYMFLLGEFQSNNKDSITAYNAAIYVVSHAKTFKSRARKMVREAYENRFQATEKQRAKLDMWATRWETPADSEKGEMTTEEEA